MLTNALDSSGSVIVGAGKPGLAPADVKVMVAVRVVITGLALDVETAKLVIASRCGGKRVSSNVRTYTKVVVTFVKKGNKPL